MPLVPNVLERLWLLRLNQGPGVLLDVFAAALFRAVGAGTRLGVFEALAAEPLTVPALAARLGCPVPGVAALTDVLVAGGYLRRRGDALANTPLVTRWLLPASPDAVADFVAVWQGLVFELWDGLEESVRRGGPAEHLHDWLERTGRWPTFNGAMRAMARVGAEEVARRAGVPATARRLLDVGGSHGLFSVAFCRRHPRLQAVILDRRDALAAARDTIAATRLDDRIAVREGDMTAAALGEGWDVVLLSNVLHYVGPEANAALLARVASALAPGGRVVISEQLAGQAPTPGAEAVVQLLSLNYFATLGARVYTFGEIAGWLAGAGFAPPSRVALRTMPGQHLVIAERPG